MAEYLTNSFYYEGIISDEDKEIVRFGLESMMGNLLSIALTLVVGIYFKCIRDALLLWPFLFLLRKNAGGYHAETKTRCLFISAVMLVVTFALFTMFDYSAVFYGVCVFVTGYSIWIWTPVDNPSKELDEVEHNVYRMRSRTILLVEGTIFTLALYFKWKTMMSSVAMAFFIVSVSLLMGRYKVHRKK